MWRNWKKWLYPVVLVGVCLVLIWQNYLPGTYLTGWDTLHPEFNFAENFRRLFFGVWRPEQGLGAVAGHAHMADLPRVFLLYLWSFFLPISFLRYAYVFFCLILGPIGVYYLVKQLLQHKSHSALVGFLTALFYLMNYSTVQQFFVPFEMFPTQWAYLPWLIYFSIQFLQSRSKSWLFLYSTTTFFASPQAYAAHLWYPFFALYLLFLLIESLLHRSRLKLTLLLLIVTLTVNSFWLIPNAYFILTKGHIARENLQNQLYSQEFLAQNRATGKLADATLIKGFYFNWGVYDFSQQENVNLMRGWNAHLANWDIRLVGYGLFILSAIGFGLIISRKQRHYWSLAPFFVLGFVFIANRTWPFSLIFDTLIRFTLFEEALRFSFTKVSIVYLFGQAMVLSVTLDWLFTISRNKRRQWIMLGIYMVSIIIYFLPAFQGGLIAKEMQQVIPTSYFDYWRYMQQQAPGRILTLPLNNNSGWVYYDWHYQGSGLIWFGAKQSVMDRDFDRWSQYNEQAYREFYNALYTQKYDLFEHGLEKYRIKYIVRDLSQNPPVAKNRDQITLRRESNDFFRSLQLAGRFRKVVQFGSIVVYELKSDHTATEVGVINREINPSYVWHLADWNGEGLDYLSNQNESTNYYPFRKVFISQNRINGSELQFYRQNNRLFLKWQEASFRLGDYQAFTAKDLKRINPTDQQLALKEDGLVFNSRKGTHGLAINLGALPVNTAYLIGINSRYVSGFPLRLCLENIFIKTCQVNDQLTKGDQIEHWDYFLIPTGHETTGYNLMLNALSYGEIQTQTIVKNLLVIPVPLETLTRIGVNVTANQPSQLTKPESEQSLWNGSQWQIKAAAKDENVVLWQAFDTGWKAYLNGRELKDHVLVNNWANGWQIPEGECSEESCTVKIVFWPQYLQFIGYFLAIATVGGIVFFYRSSKRANHTSVKHLLD